jgi:hypothetical protein
MKKKTVAGNRKMAEIQRLRKENRALRETCEILADTKLMQDIKKSMRQIRQGKVIPLSKL